MALLYGAVEAAAVTDWHMGVAHVHHGWRAREAERDLAFVADHARRLGLRFFGRRVDAAASAKDLRASPEAGARHVALCGASRNGSRGGSRPGRDRSPARRCARVARSSPASAAAASPRSPGPRESRADGVVRPLLEVTREEILALPVRAGNRVSPRLHQRRPALLAQPRAAVAGGPAIRAGRRGDASAPWPRSSPAGAPSVAGWRPTTKTRSPLASGGSRAASRCRPGPSPSRRPSSSGSRSSAWPPPSRARAARR